MNSNNKLAQKFKKVNLSINILLIIGIVIIVNYLSYQIFYRWDLTKNNDYLLSGASKKTVAELDDVVNVKAYFSKDLPSQLISLRQDVEDILDGYVSYSKGNLIVEYIDPKSDEDIEQELAIIGIPQLQFNALEKDRLQVVNGYFGLVIKYGDKTEIIPVIQDTKNLEYNITSAIKKVISDEIAVLGYWQGNGCANYETDISVAKEKLEKLYSVKIITDKIEEDVDTLIVLGPKEKFTEEQKIEINGFLEKGGKLLAMIDGVIIGDGLSTMQNEVGLNEIFENYGFRLNMDLVLDVSSGMASFSQGFMTFTTNYPFWPKIIKTGFNENYTAVAELESLILPWVSSIDLVKENDDNEILVLAKTTERAWTQKNSFNLNPQGDLFAGAVLNQHNLSVLSKKGNGEILLVSDGDFMRDSMLQNNPDNLLFFQNLVDGLSIGEDLINIRSKGITNHPIKEISDSNKIIIRYANVFGITFLVLIFGLVRYYLRKKSRLSDEII